MSEVAGSWVYTSGGDQLPCVTEKQLLNQLLERLESAMKTEDKPGGVVLTTVLDDNSILYLIAAAKMNGLLKRFMDLVAGFTSLETIFKKKNICKKFNLKFLDKYTKSFKTGKFIF